MERWKQLLAEDCFRAHGMQVPAKAVHDSMCQLCTAAVNRAPGTGSTPRPAPQQIGRQGHLLEQPIGDSTHSHDVVCTTMLGFQHLWTASWTLQLRNSN